VGVGLTRVNSLVHSSLFCSHITENLLKNDRYRLSAGSRSNAKKFWIAICVRGIGPTSPRSLGLRLFGLVNRTKGSDTKVKIHSLIWLSYTLLFLAAISGLLLTVSFTRGQRKRFPLLRKLDGKQIYLLVAVVVCSALGYLTNIYKETATLDRSFEVTYGPGLSQAEKATSDGITIELQQGATEQLEKARDFFKSGEHYFAEKRYRDAATSYQASLDVIPTLSAYLNLSLSLRYLSDYQSAEPVVQRGLQLARSRSQRKFEGHFLLTLAAILIPQGKLEQADDALRQSLEIFKQVDDRLGQANAILNLGDTSFSVGNLDDALRRFQEALKLFETMHNVLGEANAHNNIGLVHVDRFQFDEASAAFQSALEKYREIDNLMGQTTTFGNIANVYAYQGKYQHAEDSFQSGIEIARKAGNLEGQARLMANLGNLYDKEEKTQDSLKIELQALELAKGIPYIQAGAANIIADCYLTLHKVPEALKYAQMALEISQGQNYPAVRAETLNTLGDIYLQQNKMNEALGSFNEALKINNEGGVASSKPHSLRGLGLTYLALGDKQKALDYWQQALQLYKSAGIDSPDSQDIEALIDHIDDPKFIQKHR
jgi:tetratricopeptide (TPR) repeat protein